MKRERTEQRSKAVWGSRVGLALAMVATVVLPSCSKAVRTGQASSYLIITSLVGGQQDDTTVESDVVSDDGTVFTDVAQATFELQMKDPNGLGPSPANSITLSQYRVEYVRSDGRNVQGVDIPFSFTGGVTTTISDSGSVGFTLVRLQAKQESPLRALRSGGGARVISTIARITFYGHDQTGREVSVTGNLDVTFADWAG